MSSEIFRTRKHLAQLKREAKDAVLQYSKYPVAQRRKAVAELERTFRQEAEDLGCRVQDIDEAVKKIFVKVPGDRE